MRLAIIILLIFSILPETGQLLKIPSLLHHYLEHDHHHEEHSEDSTSDFFSYVKDHYTQKDNTHNHPEHEDDHQDLPFKSCSCAHHLVMIFARGFDFFIAHTFYIKDKSSYFTVSDDLIASPLFSIWQPPKI